MTAGLNPMPNLPIYIISGTSDPVANNSKGILAMVERFKDYNIKDVTYKLYKDARHELFNEINREEVFKDLFKSLNFSNNSFCFSDIF